MKKKVKYNTMSDSELQTQLKDSRKELREHRFQYAVARSLENPLIIRNLKRKVAKLLTLQREREIAAEKAKAKK